VEFEKNKNELTFQPNLKKKKPKAAAQRHKVNQRSIMDNIERMRRAREEREFKRAMTERGYQPGVSQKAMQHGVDKKPLKEKAYNYTQKKVSARRPPEQSTLFQEIGHIKQNKGGDVLPEKPQPRPASKVIKPANRKPLYQPPENRRPAQQRKKPSFRDRQHEEELKEMSPEQESPEPVIQEETPSPEPPREEDHGAEKVEDEAAEGEDLGNPLLFVDVNLGPGRAERIVVYEGDTAEDLADEFTRKHGLDSSLKGKLVGLLQDQIAGLLERISEAESNQSEEYENEGGH
jgi:hypothetical protein